MKFLKGFFIVISIVSIAFSCFFVFASATGRISMLTKIEAGIAMLANSKDKAVGLGSGDSNSTVSMLTSTYGLTTSQAGQVIALAEKLGVNTSDPVEMNGFIAKNAGNASEIKGVAERYQSGQISEEQAKALLAGIVDV